MRGAATALLLAAGLAACCGRAPPAEGRGPALRVVPLRAAGPGGGLPVARVEIAADEEARHRGLMGRRSLGLDSGMLFVYPAEKDLHFWMKDCPIPLAAAFLDGGGRVLNIAEMAAGEGVPEADLPFYDSAGRARFVLEMERGWFAEKGIRAGDLVDLAPALEGVVPR